MSQSYSARAGGTAEPEEAVSVFDGSLGQDLRAMRARRRRLVMEILLAVLGALGIGAACGVLLSH